jgi:hypothetical protein
LTRERVRQIEVDALKKLYARMMDDKPLRFSLGETDEPRNTPPVQEQPRPGISLARHNKKAAGKSAKSDD